MSRVALVTGGTRGIGEAISIALKDAGMKKGIVIIGVDDEKVTTNADFRLAMLDKRAGDTVELHYRESAETGDAGARSVKIKLR